MSIGCFGWLTFRSAISKLLGKPRKAECVILYYHAVPVEQRSLFARQMDELLRSNKPIAAGSRDSLAPGANYAAVTFDDGIRSAVENAIPELVQRRIPATIFVVADYVGRNPDWETFGPKYDPEDRTVTLDQIEALPADLITIGSHTLSHPWLPSLPETKASEEISSSREKLKSLIGRDVTLFSFPYGAMNPRLVRECREAGYERVFTIAPSLGLREPDEFETGRVAVDPTDWPIEFRLKLAGAYRWLPPIYSLKRKIVGSPARDI